MKKKLDDYKIIQASQMIVGFYHIIATSVIGYAAY